MTTMDRPRDEPRNDELSTGRKITNLLIGLVVLVAGLALIFGMVPGDGGRSVPGPSTSSTGSGPSVEAGSPSTAALGAARPLRVAVPGIRAESSLIATGLRPDGSLEVPPVSAPMQASWYDQSPTPGEVGPAVVLGHVNGNGEPGVFADLDRVTAGQEVLVDRADGRQAVFRVSQVLTVPKDSFPTDLVYNDTTGSTLRLITCGGDYDAGDRNYLSNIIVFADLVDVRTI